MQISPKISEVKRIEVQNHILLHLWVNYPKKLSPDLILSGFLFLPTLS